MSTLWSFLYLFIYLNTVHCWTVDEIEETFLSELNRTKIRENLKILTKNPHVGGSIHNNNLAEFLAEKWKSYGFDSVQKDVYEVLLSFPDEAHPNTVQLLNENDDFIFTSQHRETLVRSEDHHEDLISMFNAFSPNGTAEGEPVYANYARLEDFLTLTSLGVNITGKIIIARYGKIYRGNKLNLAAEYGAVGLILFSDPYEYAQDGEEPHNVYPSKEWLPATGAQRGSVSTGTSGDTQTPGYPSLHNVYRIPTEHLSLPKIPCQPIGYSDAKQILKMLGGFSVSEVNWDGHSNNDFNIGPGFKHESSAKKIRLTVNNQLKLTNITNVIGIIKGSVEPDRYVLAGNHRDSWGFGAVDASSGTAQMTEVTRVFGYLLSNGWRPRRSLVFCSFDAEEFSITGSYEWVQDKLLKLTHRAVAYINTDACVMGQMFAPDAAPFLAHLLLEVTKKIPSPTNESQTLYETWKADLVRNGLLSPNEEIKVRGLGGGTDHVPFFAYAGIPAIDLSFQTDYQKYARVFSAYPTYHTIFDTFHLVDTLVDPEYRLMAACGHLNLFLLRRLSDTDLLPFNMSEYRNSIMKAVYDLLRDKIWESLTNRSFELNHLNASIHNFIEATEYWELRMENFTTNNPILVRAINDQLLQLDKAFLKSNGIPLQPQYKHLVFALSLHNMYGSSTFPGIRDLLHEIINQPEEHESHRHQLEKHLSDLMIAFHTATNILQPVHIV